MQGDGGEDGQQVGEAGRDISSTPSDDVEMLEEQDQELVVGTGTHLGGVVEKVRVKVKHTNASEKREMGRRHGDYQVQLSLGDTQGATMWVHKGADLELYS
jgi:hypothetical protein